MAAAGAEERKGMAGAPEEMEAVVRVPVRAPAAAAAAVAAQG